MKELLNKDKVYRFLESFEKYSKVEILETAKESQKLVTIAQARGIKNLRNDRDLSGFKAIYAFADRANANGAILPEKPLLKALPSIIGKPVNIGHDRKFVVGHILDYAYQQKEKKVIVYGVFYKSCFDTEWEQAKKDFKAGNLSVSFEIWNPASKRQMLPDGNYLMLEQEMAGMAILFKDTEPAFKGAKVLEFAKKRIKSNADLVYAEKDKFVAEDLHYFKNSVEENLQKMKQEEQQAVPVINCTNCKKEFQSAEPTNIKCPSCFAILDNSGTMIYPPQIFNFSMSCPSCGVNSWLKMFENEETSDIKCQDCSKEYRVTFAKEKKNELIDKMNFLYRGYATCPQCQSRNSVSGTSKMGTIDIDCHSCPLNFKFNRETIDSKKQIAQINEILPEPKEEIKEEPKEEKKEEEKKVEIPKEIEQKVKEEQKKNEAVKDKEAPSAEKKTVEEKPVEKKEEPKAEVKEEPKAKEAPVKSEVKKPVKAEKEDLETEMAKSASKQVEADSKEEKKVSPGDFKATVTVDSSPVIKMFKSTKTLRKAVTKIKKLKQLQKELTVISNTVLDEENKKNVALVSAVKKTASQVISLREEVAKIKKEAEDKVKLYLDSAQTILSRRAKLGSKYSENLSDEEILIEDKFERAKLQKENDLLSASKEDTEEEVVLGTKEGANSSAIDKARKLIDDKAFGRVKRDR